MAEPINKKPSKSEKSTFVWDSSEKGKLKHKPIGKRSTMAKWDQEFTRAMNIAAEKSKAKKAPKLGKVREATHD